MLNIASLPRHPDEIRLLLHDKKLDMLALNETRLESDFHFGRSCSIQGDDVLHAGRKRNGGGVCIYVRCHVKYENRLEAVCLEVKRANSWSFTISSVL